MPEGHGVDPESPQPLTRTARREAERRARRHPLLRRVGAVLLTLALLAVAGTAYAVFRLNSNINKEDVSGALGTDRPTQSKVAGGDPINLLVLGSDVRTGSGNTGYGNGSWEPGAHSDTNLLVHISGDRTSVMVVSIPRDSMVLSPVDCSPTQPKSEWQVHQWNRNYTTAGAGCVIRTLEGNTGIFINHYVVLDFNGFKDMVDALGGVEVCTKVAIDDPASKLTLSPGRHVLSGQEALGYVRVRKTLGDGSDLGRIKRQQAFLSSVAQKAMSTELLLRPDKLYSFLSAATSSLTTDPQFTLGTMKDVADSVRNLGIKHIQFVTVPTEQYPADHNRVQWSPSADLLWESIRADHAIGAKPTATPSPSATAPVDLTVSPDKITVSVVNASGTTGLARQAGKALTVQGFTVSAYTTGPTVTTGATIEYGAGKADAAKTVAAAFPGATLEENPSLGASIRVTLGATAPFVVEVPNRVGTTPLPTPSISPSVPSPTESIETRTADTDICT